MSPRPFQLRTLVIGDEPGSWEAAEFVVNGSTTTIADTVITLVGTSQGRGILAAGVDGIGHDIDGMPFGRNTPDANDAGAGAGAGPHPNGTIELDHLVAMSPDMDRTTAALVDAGLEHRRSRTFTKGGQTRRQAFFWLGEVILELAGDDTAHDEGPATLWGVAFTCADLAQTAERLGSLLGSAKPAVQPGREIATVRSGELDISVPIVLMSPHPPDAV